MKPIVLIRLSKSFHDLTDEAYNEFSSNIERKVNDDYIVMLINGENHTDKTTIEIIK